jgi:3-hydroxypropanoate dehydrogenase
MATDEAGPAPEAGTAHAPVPIHGASLPHDASAVPEAGSVHEPGAVQNAGAIEADAPAETPVPEKPPIDEAGLAVLFKAARTHNKWTDRPVTDDELRALFDLLKMGPTSANCAPARFVFLRTEWQKDRLKPALSAGNIDKTMSAPVVVIVATDPHFYDNLPRLFPHADAKSWFSGNPMLAEETATRNATLQGAYLILAARALGLDCGPMSGFDNALVDEIFLSDRGWKSNFLVNIGHGDPAGLLPRSPRLDFDEACLLL